jgi:hypothetical protein
VTPDQQIKTALDTSIGTIGASSPLWIQHLQQGAAIVAAVGGAILVVIRLLIAWRDWRAKT